MEHGKKKMEKKKRTSMMYGKTPMKGGGKMRYGFFNGGVASAMPKAPKS